MAFYLLPGGAQAVAFGAGTSYKLDLTPPSASVTPSLSVEYLDASSNRQTTSVIDNVTTISGTAPFSVQFDGYGSVSEQVDSDSADEAYWNLGYLINYGESLGTTWSISGLPSDTDRGFPIFAHTYTTPGTHQARLTCRDSAGNQSFIRVNIIVSAPSTGIDMTSGVIPTWANDTVYNAPAGGTWGNVNFSGLRNIIIRKTGSGADPVFGTVTLEGDAPTSGGAATRAKGIRFLNCDVAQVAWGSLGADYCSFVNGRVRQLNIPPMYYYADQALIGSADQATNTRTARGIFLQNTGTLNPLGNTYNIINECRSLHLKNVTSIKTDTSNHNIRGVFAYSSFRHCLLNNTTAGSVSYWKFQGWDCTTGTSPGVPDAWPSSDMVVTAAGGRRLGLPSSKVAVVDCHMGLAGSDQPDANAGFGPENNNVEPAQGCELSGFEYCDWYWPTNWYAIDLTGRHIGRRDCKLDNGAGADVSVSAGVSHPNRTPTGWAGPYYTTGTRPVVIA